MIARLFLEDMGAGCHDPRGDEEASRMARTFARRNPQRHGSGFEQLLPAQGLVHSSPTVNVDFAPAFPIMATNPPVSTASSQPNSTLTLDALVFCNCDPSSR